MKLLLRRKWWIASSVTILAVVAWYYFTRHRPVARISLPDGTELRLEYVTYGTEHRVRGANRLVAWATAYAQRWPKLKAPLYVAEYSYGTAAPTAGLWFTHYDPKAEEFLPITGNNVRVESMDTGSKTSLKEQARDLPTPSAVYFVEIYDRRKAEMQLRITARSQATDLTIANPALKTPFPVWQPETLPQTRRVGELEVVLASVEALQLDTQVFRGTGKERLNYPYVRANFRILDHGIETKGLRFTEDMVLSDATGNHGYEMLPPPYSEAAWKIKRSFLRTSDYPFPADEGTLLGPVPMPAANKLHVFELPRQGGGETTRLAVLFGAGTYIWRGGVLVEAGETLTQAESEDALLWGGEVGRSVLEKDRRAERLIITAPGPALILLDIEERNQGVNWTERQEIAVRMHWGERSYGLKKDLGSIRISDQFHASIFADPHVYELTSNDAAPPPPGTPVILQIVPLRPEAVEFIVAPPSLPAPPQRKEKK